MIDDCRRKAIVASTADDSAVAECYKEATRKRPYLARAWYDLGVVLLEFGRKEQAIAAFRSALRANPDSTLAAHALARAETAAAASTESEATNAGLIAAGSGCVP